MNPATALRNVIPVTALVAAILPAHTAPADSWASRSPERADAVAWAVATGSDDDRPYLKLESPSVTEGDSTTTLTFTARLVDENGRTKSSTQTITAAYKVSTEAGNTATEGVDYQAASGTLTFAPGDTIATVDVTVLGDTEEEGDETLTMRLVSPWTNVLLIAYTATGIIRDDDARPFLGVGGATVQEGDAGTATLTFTARLTDANGQSMAGKRTITAAYRVSTEEGNTATAGTDYTETSGTLTFAPGETVKTVDVTVHGDTEDEDDETLTLRWTTWANVLLASYTAVGTIEDDDEGVPAVTISDASADEGDAISFTVTLDKAVASGLTVTPSFTDGTATAGTDYTPPTSALDFAGTAGETATFTVQTTQDPDWEEDETFTVGLSVSGTSTTVTSTATATGTIRNDDPNPFLSLSSPSVAEGDAGTTTLTFTARLSDANGQTQTSSRAINASYRVSTEEGNTATAGTDYTETSGTVTFAPGEISKAIDVTVHGDTEAEDDETLTMRWTTWDGDRVLLASYTATGTIEDDDTPTEVVVPAVTIADAEADEGKAITFTVTLDLAVAGGLQVTPSFTDGTATSGTDYDVPANALDFVGIEGETATFTVPTTQDPDWEEDETFTVGLSVSGTSDEVTATATATGTIRNDDPNPFLSLSSPSVAEGDAGTTTLTFTARMSDANGQTQTSSRAISASYRVSTEDGNTATAGTDYEATSGTVTFAPGEISKTIDVTVHGDTEDEDDETLTMRWTSWQGDRVFLASYTATGTIEDDDTTTEVVAPAVTISDAEADEGKEITFTVTLDQAVAGGLTVTPSFTDGTATSGTDYTASTSALSFAGTAGETATFTVPTTQDPDWEEDETFTVGLSVSGTSEAVTATATATGTIRNDDPDPFVSLTSPTVTEGDAGTATLTFTARLSDANGGPQVSSRTITVSYRVSSEDGNTATAGTDYTETSGTLTFAPGETVKTVDVTVHGDTEAEGDETLTFRWTTWANVLLASYTATGTIEDDDRPAVTISDAEADEGKSIAFTVTLDKAVPGGLTVTPSFTDGTATKGTDYTENTTALDFAGTAGETVSFTVPTTDDGDVEEDETFTVGLSVSGTSHTVTATSTATGTIKNDDETDDVVTTASTNFSLSSNVSSRNEKDGAVTVTVTATANSGSIYDRTVTVSVGYQNDTATEGTDYNTVNSFTITIIAFNQAGTAYNYTGTGTFTLTPKQDNLVEGNETIKIGGTSSAGTVGSTTIILTDDEIALSTSPTSVDERSAARTVTVTASGSQMTTARTVTVSVGKSGDGATEGTDYTTVNDFNITIPVNAASATGTFTLTPTKDNTLEADETISITGTSTGYNVVGTTMTLTDRTINLSLDKSSVSEGGHPTEVTVTATTGSAISSARVVRISLGGTATPGTDYGQHWDFNLTIAANQTSGTAKFNVNPIQDGLREADETIVLSGSLAGYTVNTATFTIRDDDTVPDVSLNLSASSIGEGSSGKTITVTLWASVEKSWPRNIKVSVGKSGDGATEGTDYNTVDDFTIQIPASPADPQGTGSFTLKPKQDTEVEGTERITVSGSHSTLSVGTKYVSLHDDDATTITLSANKTSVSEGASATSVTVTATAATAQTSSTAVTVRVGNNSTATASTDYAIVNDYTITIPANQTSATGNFTLTPTQDTQVEGDETIRIDGSAGHHSVTGTSVTLSDDDRHAITLSASPTSVSEGASGTTVTVRATATKKHPTARAVAVAVGGSGTATSGTDYTAVSNFTVTIPANDSTATGTFTLTPTDDSTVEGDETIGISGSGTLMNVTGTSITLSENDTYAVSLSASPDSLGEGDSGTSVTVTATTTAISTARTVTVSVGDSNDSATDGTDYSTVADFSITIAANATTGTGTFTLTPTQDTSTEGEETISISGSGTLMTVTGTSIELGDDDVRAISLSANKTTVSEGAGATTVTVTATANSAVSEATTVTVSVGASGDGATDGTDYTSVDDFDITISASSTTGTGTFTLTPTDDSTYEGDESVSITGSSSPHTVTGTSLAIGNNDGIAITLSVSPDSVLEGAGSTAFTVTATANTTALTDIDVDVEVGASDDSATEGTDYPTVNDFELTIAKGSTTGTGTFNLIPNSDKRSSEEDETVSVDGSSSPHTVTGTSLTLTNASAVNPITLSVSPSSVSEGAAATTVTVTARMHTSYVAAIDMTVTVGTSGSAKSGTDYAAVSDITLTFAANSTTATGTFTLTPTDDSVVEDNETVWVDGSSTGREVVGTSVTINDDDGAGITLSASPGSVSEGASGTSVTVTATPDNTSSTARTVTVSVGSTGDPAISGTDYADVSDFTITIAANAANGTGTFTLTPTQDKVVEGSESLTISGSGTGLNVTGTSLSLTDDDTAPSINLSVSPTSFTEGASDPLNILGGKTVTVTAEFSSTNTYDYDQTVAVSVGGSGTATSGTDYDAVSDFNVKIAAGQTSGTGTFKLTSSDDSVYEGDETIGVAGTATGLTVNSATLTLADNESATVTINDASATEGSDMTFTVTLDNAVEGGLTVTPDFTDVTATEGTDYDENTAALSFTGTANETKTFTVSTTQDDVVESSETFTVGLSVSDAPSGVTSTDTGTGTINVATGNSADKATLTINDASADEGGNMTFTVTLDKPVQGGLTVTPSFTDGTAVEGTDYDENTTGISFTGTANESKTFTVSTTEDAVVEGNETFTVGLSVSGTTLGSSITSTDTGTGTINNDDGATVTVNDASASEGESISFTVTLGAAVQGGLTVTPGFTNGTAASSDYTENTTALSFTGTAGETKSFTVSTAEDAVLESNETFTVDLTVSGTTLTITATDTGTGTINDDDDATVTINDASSSEGESMTFTVTLDEAVQGGLKVTPGFTDVSAVEGTDYDENTTALTFTGTKGETKTFTVSTTEDAVLEKAETFTVGLTVSGTTLTITSTDTGTGTINNDDATTVTIDNADADEGGDITFTVTLSEAVQDGLTVTPGFTDVTAVEGTDYDENTAALDFSGTKGETKTFTVSTTEDSVVESDETFTVALTVSDAPAGVTATDTGTGTVDDDDSANVTVSDASSSEGDEMTFTVTLGMAVQGGVKVTPSFKNGTAATGDYTANTNKLTFTGTANETKTFKVSTTEDAVLEHNETFTVELTVSDAPADVDDSDTGTGTINNDDAATVTVNDADADEGGSLTFTVTLSEAVQGGITVTPGFTDGTAVEGADYDENTTALNFTGTKGETKSFTVATTQDNLVEDDETFTVGLAVSKAPSGVTSTDTGTGTIDNEDATPEVRLSVDPASLDESASATTVTVTATFHNGNAFPVDTTVTVSVGGGSAIEGTDYANIADFGITIKAGKSKATGTFTLTPTQDNLVEGNETTEVSGSVTGLTVKGHPLTINDDDEASGVQLGVDKPSLRVPESAPARTVTVTAEFINGNAFPRDTTLTVSIGGGSATSGVDFAAVADFDLTIPAAQTTATITFTLAPTQDRVVESDETIPVEGTVNGLDVTRSIITLADDDDAPDVNLTASPSHVDEDGVETVTVTATFSTANTFPTTRTVAVSVGGGSATSGTDYKAVPDFGVSIPAGRSTGSATFVLQPIDDDVVEGTETVQISGSEADMKVHGTTVMLDEDDAHELTLTVNPEVVNERRTTEVTVLAEAEKATTWPRRLTVWVGAASDGAVEGTDYAVVPDIDMTLPANETSATATFTIKPTDDGVTEGEEFISISGTGEQLAVTGTTLTLADDQDDDTPRDTLAVTLTATPSRVEEGAGATTVTVKATADTATASARTVTVSVGAAGDGATEGTDYAAVADFDITIPANVTRAATTFTLTPTDDDAVEGDESISISGAGGSLRVAGTEVTVADDDVEEEEETIGGAVTLAVSPARVAEDAAATTVTVTATPDTARASARTVTVSVGDGGDGATEGTDYAAVADFDLAIPANATSGTATFTLVPTDDDAVEGDENISISGAGEQLTVTGTTLTLADDDREDDPVDSLAVTLTASISRLGEGAPATAVTVRATTDAATTSTRTVTVSVGAASDGAIAGTDYATVPDFDLTIPANATSATATFTLAPVDDGAIEGDETITISGTGEKLTVTGTTLTLTDDDTLPEVDLGTDPATVSEGAAPTAVTVTATLSNGSTFTTDRTVTVTVGGGEGAESDDHVARPGTDFAKVSNVAVTIPAGQTSGTATFTLTPTDDSMVEGDETIAVSGAADGLTVHATTMTVTDDDEIPEVDLTADPASVDEGSEPLAVTLTATFSNSSTFPDDRTVTVRVGATDESTAADHVAASGTDFARVSDFHVTIPAGHASAAATFTLRVADDNIVEGDETIGIAGSADELTVHATAMTVIDDDDAPEVDLGVDPASLSEGAPATTVTVTADFSNGNTFAEDRTVTVAVSGGTATAGTDYAPVPDFDVAIPAGETTGTGTFTLSPTRDDAEEGDETISITGVSDGLTVHPAAVTLADDNTMAERTRALEFSLAGIGRTVASQAVDAIGARFEASSRFSWTATANAQSGMNLSRIAGMLGAVGVDPSAMGVHGFEAGLHGAPGLGIQGVTAGAPGLGIQGLTAGTPGLGGTLGGAPNGSALGWGQPPHGGFLSLPFGNDGWTLWASGARTDFSGRPGGISMDGSIGAAYVGVDRRLGSSGVLGVAVSRSQGGVDLASGSSPWVGDVDATLTTVYPYLRWSPDGGTDLWGMLGLGRGAIDLHDDGGAVGTDGRLQMGALGLRRDVARLGALDLAVRADAFTVGMKADEVAGELRAADGRAHRARLVLDGSTSWALSSSSRLVPSVEVGARADGGDVETGPGMELGGGLAYVDAGLGLDIAARGRWLAVHRDEHFGEWGGSLSLRRTPTDPNRGLSLSAMSAWGEDASGIQALWDDHGLRRGDFGFGLRPEEADDAWHPDRMDMEVAYATPLGGERGALKPFGQLRTMGGGSRHLRLGTRFELVRGDDEDAGRLRLELLGEQRALAGSEASYGAGLNLAGDGLRAPVGRLTPFGELLFDGTTGHRLRMGTDLLFFGGDGGRPPPGAFRLGLVGESYRAADGTTKYGLVLRGGWEMEQ